MTSPRCDGAKLQTARAETVFTDSGDASGLGPISALSFSRRTQAGFTCACVLLDHNSCRQIHVPRSTLIGTANRDYSLYFLYVGRQTNTLKFDLAHGEHRRRQQRLAVRARVVLRQCMPQPIVLTGCTRFRQFSANSGPVLVTHLPAFCYGPRKPGPSRRCRGRSFGPCTAYQREHVSALLFCSFKRRIPRQTVPANVSGPRYLHTFI